MKQYIDNLPIMYNGVKGENNPPNGFIYKSEGLKLVSINWQGIDRLYYYIIPHLQMAEFHSRKHVDFVSWCITVKLYKFGDIFTEPG